MSLLSATDDINLFKKRNLTSEVIISGLCCFSMLGREAQLFKTLKMRILVDWSDVFSLYNMYRKSPNQLSKLSYSFRKDLCHILWHWVEISDVPGTIQVLYTGIKVTLLNWKRIMRLLWDDGLVPLAMQATKLLDVLEAYCIYWGLYVKCTRQQNRCASVQHTRKTPQKATHLS